MLEIQPHSSPTGAPVSTAGALPSAAGAPISPNGAPVSPAGALASAAGAPISPTGAPVSPAGDGTGLVRRYNTWKGNNVFFLGGRLIFGPDVRSLFLTIFLIVAPVAVFCVFVARKFTDEFANNAGISALVVVVGFTIFDLILLLLTSGKDPGIVPRNAYPPEPEDDGGDGEPQLTQALPFRLPRTKDMVINGITMKIKYCDTCMLYRPPRCSHCSICNNCVDKFDHHCPWVGQCIGLRNYRFYFMFVLSTTLLCIYVHVFCWIYVKKIMDGEGTSIWKALLKTPASIALIIYTFISVWFVGGLTVFHTYLISTNQSTYENFRYRYDKHANPFNKGVFQNIKEVFCTRVAPSKNNFRAKVLEEPSPQPRTIRIGFTSPNMKDVSDDIEMGRKPSWDETVHGFDDSRGNISDDDGIEKDGVDLAFESQDLSRVLPPEDTEGREITHSRESSYRRRSSSWEISPEVLARVGAGESKRVLGGNRGNSISRM